MQPYTLNETILKVSDVSLSLGGNKILRDINVEIKDIQRPDMQQGQVVSFLGPSGYGKTQFLRILAGLIKPDTGEVLMGIEQRPVKFGMVGVVQQTYPVLDPRTVMGNMLRAGRNLPKAEAKEKIESYLNHFDLYDKRDLYPNQLSGGQKQRLAIAQQLLNAGHFILMDEPFSGLDPRNIDKVSEMISTITQMHELNTIIIVSHDIGSTCAISDTIWLLGKQNDVDGNRIEGSTIINTYDLMAMNLAWRKDIRKDRQYQEFVADLRDKF